MSEPQVRRTILASAVVTALCAAVPSAAVSAPPADATDTRPRSRQTGRSIRLATVDEFVRDVETHYKAALD